MNECTQKAIEQLMMLNSSTNNEKVEEAVQYILDNAIPSFEEMEKASPLDAIEARRQLAQRARSPKNIETAMESIYNIAMSNINDAKIVGGAYSALYSIAVFNEASNPIDIISLITKIANPETYESILKENKIKSNAPAVKREDGESAMIAIRSIAETKNNEDVTKAAVEALFKLGQYVGGEDVQKIYDLLAECRKHDPEQENELVEKYLFEISCIACLNFGNIDVIDTAVEAYQVVCAEKRAKPDVCMSYMTQMALKEQLMFPKIMDTIVNIVNLTNNIEIARVASEYIHIAGTAKDDNKQKALETINKFQDIFPDQDLDIAPEIYTDLGGEAPKKDDKEGDGNAQGKDGNAQGDGGNAQEEDKDLTPEEYIALYTSAAINNANDIDSNVYKLCEMVDNKDLVPKVIVAYKKIIYQISKRPGENPLHPAAMYTCVGALNKNFNDPAVTEKTMDFISRISVLPINNQIDLSESLKILADLVANAKDEDKPKLKDILDKIKAQSPVYSSCLQQGNDIYKALNVDPTTDEEKIAAAKAQYYNAECTVEDAAAKLAEIAKSAEGPLFREIFKILISWRQYSVLMEIIKDIEEPVDILPLARVACIRNKTLNPEHRNLLVQLIIKGDDSSWDIIGRYLLEEASVLVTVENDKYVPELLKIFTAEGVIDNSSRLKYFVPYMFRIAEKDIRVYKTLASILGDLMIKFKDDCKTLCIFISNFIYQNPFCREEMRKTFNEALKKEPDLYKVFYRIWIQEGWSLINDELVEINDYRRGAYGRRELDPARAIGAFTEKQKKLDAAKEKYINALISYKLEEAFIDGDTAWKRFDDLYKIAEENKDSKYIVTQVVNAMSMIFCSAMAFKKCDNIKHRIVDICKIAHLQPAVIDILGGALCRMIVFIEATENDKETKTSIILDIVITFQDKMSDIKKYTNYAYIDSIIRTYNKMLSAIIDEEIKDSAREIVNKELAMPSAQVLIVDDDDIEPYATVEID